MTLRAPERSTDPNVKLKRAHGDFETFSELDLRYVGTSRYARHISTRVLMFAYARAKDETISQWSPEDGEPIPQDLMDLIMDPTVIFFAWNAPFERAIFLHVLGIDIPISRWRCTMALAFSLALPGKLEKAGKALGLPEDKQKNQRGKTLIQRFSKPRKPTKNKPHTRCTPETDPTEWQEFLLYNRDDVESERAIHAKIKRWNMPAHEWALWEFDQEINEAGIPINRKAVEAAIRLTEEARGRDIAEMKEITGLPNPNSTQQLLPWLRERGYPFLDLKKGHVARASEEAHEFAESELAEIAGVDEDYVRVLDLRLRTAKSGVKKFYAIEKRLDDDDHLRGTFQFAGAGRTWRWSGRGFQPHNLPRPWKPIEAIMPEVVRSIEGMDVDGVELVYGDVMEVLTSAVRPMAQAPEGQVFLDADLNAIENRVLGWLARDMRVLRVFYDGRCPYISFATFMFHQSYDALWHEYKVEGNKGKRTIAKPGVLGCGYLLGPGDEKENPDTGEMEATGLLGYAQGLGVTMTKEQAEHSVSVFRNTYQDVVQFWWDLDKAVRKVINTKQSQRVGYLRFDMDGPFLRMILPNGRALHYCRPKLELRPTPWGEKRWQITYENEEQGQWKRVTTHPGKLAENAVQAVSRDLLAHGMLLARDRGLDVRMHVHDQIITLSDQDKADHQLEVLKDCMSVRPPWADDKLPLGSEGFASPVFIKD